MTLSKGVHLVVPAPPGWQAAVTIPLDRSRVSFALPWEGMLLLGTTDEAYEGDPAAVEVTAADETEVLAEAGRALEPGVLARDLILARFAGLRRAPGPEGPHGLGAARDDDPAGPGRVGDRGGREADDLPAHRGGRARGSRLRSRSR